jgi:hypothetical protein
MLHNVFIWNVSQVAIHISSPATNLSSLSCLMGQILYFTLSADYETHDSLL